MRLKQSTIKELDQLLKENYKTELAPGDLHKLTYSLVGLFDLLAKVKHRSTKDKKK